MKIVYLGTPDFAVNPLKEILKDNGKVLLAFNNKLGMQYWCGKKDKNENEYDIFKILIEERKRGATEPCHVF